MKYKNILQEAEFINPFSGKIPDRKLNDREIMRALRLSISAEHEAIHLYEAIADSISNVKIKSILQDIANEEKVHIGELEQALSYLDKDNDKFIEKGKKEVNTIK